MIKKSKTKDGYTIIETMIAVSLFIVIVMTGMGALLNANLVHKKSQNMRSIIDNLSFIMEDMSKNLRTGYNYRCIHSDLGLGDIQTAESGTDCAGVAFEQQDGSTNTADDQWVYEIVSENGANPFYIQKSVDGGSTWVRLTPEEVRIDGITSNLSISGAEPLLGGDRDQPFITLKLSGSIRYKETDTPFSLQTSISQRMLDN